MRARVAWLLAAAAIVCLGGCAQMLGLDDYREAIEAGAGDDGEAAASWDTPGDSTLSDQRPDLSTPADAGAEASLDGATESDGGALAEGGVDAGDGSPGDALEEGAPDGAGDAGSLADATDGQAADVSLDAASDQQARDAPSDGPLDQQGPDAAADGAVCPAACNGGCGSSGNVCTIVVTQPSTGPVVCPYGLACQVQCSGTQVCGQPIACAVGQRCTVVCTGDQACDSNVIDGMGATSLCLQCVKSSGGSNSGCNAVTCTGTCSIHCNGGCSGSCGNCTQVSSCP